MHQFQPIRKGRSVFKLATRVLAGRLRRDQSGAVAVEFGLVAVPFFGLVFAIMQIALVFLSDQILETAVADAARMIRTGQAKTLGWTNVSSFNTQVCNELYYLLDCTKLDTYITSVSTFSSISLSAPVDNSGNLIAAPTSIPSAAETGSQIIVVATYYEYSTLFGSMGLSLADQANGTRLLAAVEAFKTEPFP